MICQDCWEEMPCGCDVLSVETAKRNFRGARSAKTTKIPRSKSKDEVVAIERMFADET